MRSRRPGSGAWRSCAPVAALVVLAGTTLAAPSAAAHAPADPVLVSTGTIGSLGSGPSGTYGTSVSADGSVVAFTSTATDLSPDDRDAEVDVYVKRRDTGELVLASTSSSGAKASTFSLRPSLDAAGATLAFLSAAGNLDPRDTDGYLDVFVKDLRTDVLVLVSTGTDGAKGNASSSAVDLSGDGSTVAFTSRASNLSPADDTPDADVFVKDLTTGAVTVASRRADGTGAPSGDYGTGAPSLSADGTRVAFDTDARLDANDTDDAPDVYVKDLTTGVLQLASVAPDGADSTRGSYRPSLSADGWSVAFDTVAADLVPEDPTEDSDVYVTDLRTGTLTVVSGTGGPQQDGRSSDASLSADGTTVAFSSQGAGLAAGDDASPLGTWVRDLRTGELVLASARPDGAPADALSIAPRLSDDGGTVVFTTPATDLDPADTNGWADVYARALTPPTPPPADEQPPVLELWASPAVLPARDAVTVTVSGSAADEGSGIASVRFDVEDEYGQAVPVLVPVDGAGRSEVAWTQSLVLSGRAKPSDPDGRDFSISATATDLAGNTAQTHVHVVAPGRRDHLSVALRRPGRGGRTGHHRFGHDAPRAAGPAAPATGEGGERNT